MGFWRRWAAVVSGRWTRWVTLAVWVLVATASVWTLPRWDGILSNDPVDYLPRGNAATVVAQAVESLPAAENSDLVVLYVRDAGLTPADVRRIRGDLQALQRSGALAAGARVTPLPQSGVVADGDAGTATVEADLLRALETDRLQAVSLNAPLRLAGLDPTATEAAVNHAVAAVGLPTTVPGSGPPVQVDPVGWGYQEVDGLEVVATGPAAQAYIGAAALGSTELTLFGIAAGVVVLLLLLTYRSPVLWVLPFGSVLVGLLAARGANYAAHELLGGGLVVNSVSSALLLVLVFGAGTDYALLLTARYREELRRHDDVHVAMGEALAGAGPAILASAATVSAGLLCLLVSTLATNRGLGPVTAIGIGAVLLAMLTLYPALLTWAGRPAFWPAVPRPGDGHRDDGGVWARVGRGLSRRPRPVWVAAVLVLGGLALGVTQLDLAAPGADRTYRQDYPAVTAQGQWQEFFGGAAAAPVYVLAPASQVDTVVRVLRDQPDVTLASSAGTSVADGAPTQVSGGVLVTALPRSDAQTRDTLLPALQRELPTGASVGGQVAVQQAVDETNVADRTRVIPLVLLVILVILTLLLRAVVAPLLLLSMGLLSFAATLGICGALFRDVLGMPVEDPGYPLTVFIFLVALAVDYNIFLMHRVRHEAREHGTREGILRGIAATAGVITSAGLVLAATFGALAAVPLVLLTQIGLTVAIGVLLDTFFVRTIAFPALALDAGRRLWWPGALGRAEQHADAGLGGTSGGPAVDGSAGGGSAAGISEPDREAAVVP